MRALGRLVTEISIIMLLALMPAAHGQTVTGQLTGTVADMGGAAIVGAQVQLTSEVTKQVRDFVTQTNGTFIFPDLVPGTYDLRITHEGFKTYVQNGIAVGTLEKVDVHTITLDVGEVNTSIEVQASAARVETTSSDHATAVDPNLIKEVPLRGRNFDDVVRSLPGVIDMGQQDTRGWGTASAVINGGQAGQVLVTLDGIAAQDSGAPGLSTYQSPSPDAISEVRLLTSNYSAEYGARAGGQFNVSIKSGTPEFHGTAYYYFRNEEFNANEFFNNATGVAKPKYRFENPGGTFGGPVIIPKVPFNRDHNKLFFFWSYDQIINNQSATPNHYTMPTALERTGDFSQSLNPNGSLIKVIDPTTGAQFPNNVIPAARLTPLGQAMLNLFPLPNTVDPTGLRQYNFQFVPTNTDPRTDKILRVDYNVSTRDTVFVRLLQDYQAQSGNGAILGAAGDGWGQFTHSYYIPSAGFSTTYTHIFRPNLINEATVGQNRAHQKNIATNQAQYDASLLPLKLNGQALTLPSLFPGANTLNLLPNINFGLPSGFTAASAPTPIPNIVGNNGTGGNGNAFGFDSRWPFDGTDNLLTFTDNITWVKGSHNIKVGFYFEHDARNVSVYSTYSTEGTYYFGSDLGNPVDSGDPFSNALLGSLYGYGQDNLKQFNRSRYKQTEWFVQDSWKATRRITLDLGIRFQRLGALYEAPGQTQGLFVGSAYNANAQGQLLFPTCKIAAGPSGCPVADKASINPATGAIYPYALQGTFTPGSTGGLNGTPFSGIVQQASGSAPFFRTPPLAYAPRVGFAIDPFGNGETAIRGGFGIFYSRAFGVDTNGATGVGIGPLATPPHFLAPIVLNTTFADLAKAPLVFTPQTTVGGPLSYKPPSTYNWSFGVQQDVGRGFVVDVTYIGNVAHHQFNQGAIDLNAVPPLTDWTPTADNGQPGPVSRFLDPTSANGNSAFYSANLIRALASPYPGWGGIQMYTQNGESYYDALQVQLNRRFGNRFHLGANYTYSKTLVYAREQFVSDNLLKNIAGGTRPFAANINFAYAIPQGSKLWQNKFTEIVADNWHIEGVTTFYSGVPLTINCTSVGQPIGYWTGTPSATQSTSTAAGSSSIPFRCQQTGNLWLPAGATPSSVGSTSDPRLFYPFNPASFTLPPVNSLGIGNTPPTLFYGPGVATADLNLYKQFRIRERATLEFRFQAFNALNHFNPGNPNTTLNINFKTGLNTNTAFGTVPSTASGTQTGTGYQIGGAQIPARRGVLSVRVTF
jgi:hypothetical protein